MFPFCTRSTATCLFVCFFLCVEVFTEDPLEDNVVRQPQRDPLREGGRSHDKQHIQEHLRDLTNVSTDDMSEEELQFHYFKLHDYDNNNQLDGLELVAALTHFEEHHEEGEDNNGHDKQNEINDFSDEDIMSMVDEVLKQEDSNGNGLVSYAEFRQAQLEQTIPSHETEESNDAV